MLILSKHLKNTGEERSSLKDFSFISHKALKDVDVEKLSEFAEKCDSLESLIFSGTWNCVEETIDIFTDFLTEIVKRSSKLI